MAKCKCGEAIPDGAGFCGSCGEEATKRCPFCAETILEAAIKCRFCGMMLRQAEATPEPACPYCKQHCPLDAEICPSCKSMLRAPKAKPETPNEFAGPLLIVLLFVLMIGGIMLYASESTQRLAPSITAAANTYRTHRVVYVVRGGSGKASVTYFTPGGGMEQHDVDNGISTLDSHPWRSDALTFPSGATLSFVVQAKGEDGITAEIEVDGSTWKEVKSSAAYGVASVSGRLE